MRPVSPDEAMGVSEMKILMLISLAALVISLPVGARRHTAYRKEKIREIAERLGISDLFD